MKVFSIIVLLILVSIISVGAVFASGAVLGKVDPTADAPDGSVNPDTGKRTVWVAENGSTSFHVKLTHAPTSTDVVVKPWTLWGKSIYRPNHPYYFPGRENAFTVSPSTLTFNRINYDIPQVITITGQEDGDARGEFGLLMLDSFVGTQQWSESLVGVFVHVWDDESSDPRPPLLGIKVKPVSNCAKPSGGRLQFTITLDNPRDTDTFVWFGRTKPDGETDSVAVQRIPPNELSIDILMRDWVAGTHKVSFKIVTSLTDISAKSELQSFPIRIANDCDYTIDLQGGSAQQTAGIGLVENFEVVIKGRTAKVTWEAPETGTVKDYVVQLYSPNGKKHRVFEPEKTFTKFKKLKPGVHTIRIRARSQDEKGDWLSARVTVE